jgi:plasmid stability protein
MGLINVRNVDDELHRQVKILVAKKGINIRKLIIGLLESAVEEDHQLIKKEDRTD